MTRYGSYGTGVYEADDSLAVAKPEARIFRSKEAKDSSDDGKLRARIDLQALLDQWIIPNRAAPIKAPAHRMTAARTISSRVLAAIVGFRLAFLTDFPGCWLCGLNDHFEDCRKL